jgi:hypothetical protein
MAEQGGWWEEGGREGLRERRERVWEGGRERERKRRHWRKVIDAGNWPSTTILALQNLQHNSFQALSEL